MCVWWSHYTYMNMLRLYILIYIRIFIYVHIHIHTHFHVYMYMYTHTYIHMNIYRINRYIYLYVYIYMYAWIYIHVHIRIHIYDLNVYMYTINSLHVTWINVRHTCDMSYCGYEKKNRSTCVRKQWTAEEEEKFLKALDKIGPKDTELDPRTGRVCAHLFWRAWLMCDVTHEIGLRDSELDPRTGLVCDLTRVRVTWHIYMWTHTHILNHIFVCGNAFIFSRACILPRTLSLICAFLCVNIHAHMQHVCVCVRACYQCPFRDVWW